MPHAGAVGRRLALVAEHINLSVLEFILAQVFIKNNTAKPLFISGEQVFRQLFGNDVQTNRESVGGRRGLLP